MRDLSSVEPLEGVSVFNSKEISLPLKVKDLKEVLKIKEFSYLSLSFSDKSGFDSCLALEGIVTLKNKVIFLIDSYPLKGAKKYGIPLSKSEENSMKILLNYYQRKTRVLDKFEKIKKIVETLDDETELWIAQIHDKKKIESLNLAPVIYLGPGAWSSMVNEKDFQTRYDYSSLSMDAYFSCNK